MYKTQALNVGSFIGVIFTNSVAIFRSKYSLHHYYQSHCEAIFYETIQSAHFLECWWQGEKKNLLASAGIEPAPSDVGTRNATVTPGCLILIHIDLHALYV